MFILLLLHDFILTIIQVGLSSVLTALDSVSVITQYLSYGVSTVTQIVQVIMIEILHIFHIGYKYDPFIYQKIS